MTEGTQTGAHGHRHHSSNPHSSGHIGASSKGKPPPAPVQLNEDAEHGSFAQWHDGAGTKGKALSGSAQIVADDEHSSLAQWHDGAGTEGKAPPGSAQIVAESGQAPAWHEQYKARMRVSEGQRSMKLRDWPVVECGDKMALRPLGLDMIFGHFYAPGMIAEGWDDSGPFCLPASEAFIKHVRRYPGDEEQECGQMAWDLPSNPD